MNVRITRHYWVFFIPILTMLLYAQFVFAEDAHFSGVSGVPGRVPEFRGHST